MTVISSGPGIYIKRKNSGLNHMKLHHHKLYGSLPIQRSHQEDIKSKIVN